MAVLVGVAGILITLHFRGDNVFERAEDAARSAASSVGDFAAAVFEPISGAWNSAWDYDDLEGENRQLREQINELRAGEFAERTATADLALLYADLDLTQVGEIPAVVAQVVVPLGNFQSDTIQISKGSSHGIEVGQPVVVSSGLVGRISEVRSSRAVVRTLTSQDFVVGVRFLDSNQVLPALGQGADDLLLASQDISLAPPVVGTLAVTSGLERSVYPPGLAVGLVASVEIDQGTLNNVIAIAPTVNPQALSFVSVLDYDTGLGQ